MTPSPCGPLPGGPATAAVLGEIHLQMVLGVQPVPLRVLLRNLGFIATTLPFARRRARRHLGEAVRRARGADLPGVLARRGERGYEAEIGRVPGEIARERGDPETAARHFREAEALAAELGMRPLAARCRESRAGLSAP